MLTSTDPSRPAKIRTITHKHLSKGGELGMEREKPYTTAQAAERLHLKPAALARKLSEHKLTGVNVGRRWLRRREVVDALRDKPRHNLVSVSGGIGRPC
jgi:excisionase family DNA binding protein